MLAKNYSYTPLVRLVRSVSSVKETSRYRHHQHSPVNGLRLQVQTIALEILSFHFLSRAYFYYFTNSILAIYKPPQYNEVLCHHHTRHCGRAFALFLHPLTGVFDTENHVIAEGGVIVVGPAHVR